ncbi:substrate-binding domain-containing protein, partial [Spirillospora sp. NPDC046719]
QAAAAKLLDAGCTAICGGNDIMALGAIRAARARGLRVPEDVSVTGMDDSLLTAYLDPPLTTIRQAVREMSMAAVSTVLDEIRGARSPRTELLFRPELVVRRSTAPVPASRRADRCSGSSPPPLRLHPAPLLDRTARHQPSRTVTGGLPRSPPSDGTSAWSAATDGPPPTTPSSPPS